MLLMLLGNAGIVTAVSTLVLAFVGKHGVLSPGIKIAMPVGGVVVFWAIATSRWVEKRLSRMIDRALKRHTDLVNTDYASLLHLASE